MKQPSVWLEFSPLANHLESINLGQGFPGWEPPKFIQEYASSAVKGDAFSTYARSAGHPALVKAIADFYGPRFGRDLDPNGEVVVTVGASEALFLAIMSLVGPGDEVIVVEPAFDLYFGALSMSGASIRSVQMVAEDQGQLTHSSQLKVDWSELEQQLSNKTRLLILNTPHNPSGKVFSKDEIDELTTILSDYPGCVILSDEVYEHLVYDDMNHIPLGSVPELFDRTISIYSAGKSFSVTGWKIGWATGPRHLISQLQHSQQWIVFSVATPLQEAVAQALSKGKEAYKNGKSYYEWLRLHYQDKRDFLFDGLKKAGFNPVLPEGSFFILCDIRDQHEDLCRYPTRISALIDEGVIAQDCRTKDLKDYNFCRNLSFEKGVTGIPSSAFYTEANREKHAYWARFAFCKSDEELEKAVRRLS